MKTVKFFTPKRILIFLGVVAAVTALTTGTALGATRLYRENHKKTVDEAYTLEMETEKLSLLPGEEALSPAVLQAKSEEDALWAAEDYAGAEIYYRSGDDSVATVDENGLITGISPGETVVTAYCSGLAMERAVEVYIPAEKIKLQNHRLRALLGEEIQLSFDFLPSGTTRAPGDIVFSSSDPKVVSVSETGLARMTGPGTATVKVTAGELTDECVITVSSHIKSVTFSLSEEEILKGETCQASVKFEPENTSDSTVVTWETDNEAVAIVDETGLVTGVGPGDAVITGTLGSFKESFNLHVLVPVENIRMFYAYAELHMGETKQLSVDSEPLDANEEIEYKWESSNPAVVTVDENGLITAVGPGNAKVTASFKELSTATEVTVVIPVTGVNISAGAMTLNKGQSAGLSASVVPGNTTESPYITWSSDNLSVATVDGNGVVTAVGPGEANITANHDLVGASCHVTVYSPMTGISLGIDSLQIIESSSATLSVSFIPADTTDDRSLGFVSSDTSVAEVLPDGTVKGISTGRCVVTALCGGYQVSVNVEVTPYIEVESISLSAETYTFSAFKESFRLTASVTPANASGTVSFTTSNSAVATVDGAGNVTAVGSGTATITATAGKCAKTCTVTVPLKNKVVVLDPGHGLIPGRGTYCGAYYYGTYEDVINLKVAKYCKAYLESHYSGVEVYLTRSDENRFYQSDGQDLEYRAIFAQEKGADVLVSLHFNATTSHSARGCLCFVSAKSNVSSACSRLANSILSRLSALGLSNRGPVTTLNTNGEDYYAINRHAANRGIPGIIVEHCFMDTEPEYYNTDAALERLGIADAQGIADYLGLSAK